ncbi:hypothetical protein CBL_11454 [Carabus blaptoides fortunei]
MSTCLAINMHEELLDRTDHKQFDTVAHTWQLHQWWSQLIANSKCRIELTVAYVVGPDVRPPTTGASTVMPPPHYGRRNWRRALTPPPGGGVMDILYFNSTLIFNSISQKPAREHTLCERPIYHTTHYIQHSAILTDASSATSTGVSRHTVHAIG